MAAMKGTTHDGKIDHFTLHEKNEGPRKYPLKQLESVTYYQYVNKVSHNI